jgi:hypothetical protein
VKLHPINDQNLDQALALLMLAFPKRTERFWTMGLERARAYSAADSGWPIGFLLESNDRIGGVMLTFPSYRHKPDGHREVVINLSSWYVAPEHRSFALMMLVKLLADQQSTYTDLTPSPSVLQMIDRLRFTTWNEGLMLTSWPLLPKPVGRPSELVQLDELPAGALAEQELRILEDHAALGCTAGALYDGEAFAPLVLHPTRIWRLPAGRVLYARSREQVLSQLRPIAKFAWHNGMPLLALDVDRNDCGPGRFFWSRGIKAFRGTIPRDRIDYAYSELVFLNHAL